MDRAAGEVDKLTRAESAHEDQTRKSSRATRSFTDDLSRARDEVRRTGNETNRLGNFLSTLGNRLRSTERGFRNWGDAINSNHESIAKLDNQLRGLLTLGIITFAQQITTAITAGAGAFLALANSAFEAGAGIAAAMTSAAAQAIPAITLIIAAWGRVGAVFDAVKQAQKAAIRSGDDHTASMDKQATAAESVRSAQEGVADANRRVEDATKALHEAEVKRRQNLEDLIIAEQRATQAREGAERTLSQAIATGDVDALAGAETDLAAARIDQRRARSDLGTARTGRDAGLTQARRALDDAERAADRARRQFRNASREASNAADQVSSTQRTLDQLLAQLSPAERRLFESTRRLQDSYKRLFRPITDIIVGGVADTVDRLNVVLDDNRIVGSMRRLATEMRTQLGRLTDFAFSDRSLDFFARMSEEARRNLGPLTDLGINLAKIFQNVAEAGIPAFRMLLRFVGNLADRGAAASENSKPLEQFITTGARHAIAWAQLAGAVVQLFLALGNAGGSRTGLNLVNDLTGATERATNSVERNRESVAQFFEDSREVMHQIARVVEALGEALLKIFDPEGAKVLADFLIDIMIPALTTVILLFGKISHAVLGFLDLPFLRELTKLVLEWGFFFIAMQKVVGVFGLFLGATGKVTGGIVFLAEALVKIPRLLAAIRVGAMLLASGQVMGAIAAFRAALAGTAAATTAEGVGAGVAGGAAAGGAGLAARLGPLAGFLPAAGVGGAVLAAGVAAPFLQRAMNPRGDFGIPTSGGFDTNKLIEGVLGRSDAGKAEDALKKFGDRLEDVKDHLKELSPTQLKELREEAVRLARNPWNEQFRDKLRGVIDTLDRLKPHAAQALDILNEDTLRRVLRRFDTFRIRGFDSISQLGRFMQTQFQLINQATLRGSETWQQLVIKNFGDGIQSVRRMMRDGTISVSDGMKQIRTITRDQMRFVRNHMDELSDQGRIRLSRNFARARAAIEKQMEKGTISTKEGMEMIRDLMASNLRMYGFTPAEIRNRLAGKDFTGKNIGAGSEGNLAIGDGAATGGWLGRQGERGGDGSAGRIGGRPVGRGEGVINWAHQRYIQPALQFFYGHGLNEMFQRVRGEHAGGLFGGLASGGYVQGAQPPSGPGSGPIRSLAQMLFRLGFSVTSGGEHRGTGTWHDRQRAIDLGSSVNDLRRLAGILMPRRGQFEELFGPSAFVGLWKRGTKFQDAALQSDHEDHIHVALLSRLFGTLGQAANFTRRLNRIIRKAVGDRSGPLQDIQTGALRQVGAGARERLNQILAASTEGVEGQFDVGNAFTGGSVAVARSVARAWRQSRKPLEALLSAFETVLVEAGGMNNPAHGDRDSLGAFQQRASWASAASRMNPFESALRFFARWRDVGTPGQSAQHVQVSAYPDRYDAAEGAARAWLRRIGFNQFAMGGEIPGMLGQAVPILAHAKEWVLNIPQQMRAAALAGLSREGLRSAIGLPIGESSAQGGTEVARRPRFELPTVPPLSVSGLEDEAREAIRFLNNVKQRAENFMKNFTRGFAVLAREGGVFDLMNEAIERLTNELDVHLRRITYRTNRSWQVLRRLNPVRVAEIELNNLERVYGDLVSERGVIMRTLREITERLRRGGLERGERQRLEGFRRNMHERLVALDGQIAENLQNRFDAFTNVIEQITNRAEERLRRRTEAIERSERLAGIIGPNAAAAFGIDPATLARQRQEALQAQVEALRQAQKRAAFEGRQDLVKQLDDQIADIQLQITEAAVAGIQGQVQVINDQAARRQGALDRRGRLADLLERAGNPQAAFAERGAILQGQRSSIEGQIGELRQQQKIASAQGMTGLVADLDDQIAELETQLAENTAAIAANTIAARQAAIDAITNRQQFRGGVFGGLQGLLQALAANTGNLDLDRMRDLIRAAGGTLSQTGQGLRQQLVEGFGIDLRGLDPTHLADALSHLNFDQIEAGFSVDQRQQFEALIQAIIENATQLEANTTQLEELGNSLAPQTFSSSAWRIFRQAIFTGMGGLLPEYASPIPHMQAGGIAMSEGAYWLHPGEVYRPSDWGGGGDKYSIEINEAGGPIDVPYLASRLSFERKGRR